MQTIALQMRLKGGRYYIHGTDIYNVMLDRIAALHPQAGLGAVRLVIHKTATTQCRMVCSSPQEAPSKPPDAVVHMQVEAGEGRIEAWLVETGEAVTERVAYDEDRVEQLCRYGEGDIKIEGASGYTTIETAVAMTKFLHQRIFPPEVGKWWFTRLQLSRPFAAADTARLRIHFLEDLGAGRLTRSAVYSGEELVGHIFFAARKP
jgi:hypothetical protein